MNRKWLNCNRLNCRTRYLVRLIILVFTLCLLLYQYFLTYYIMLGVWKIRNYIYQMPHWYTNFIPRSSSCYMRKNPFTFVLSSTEADLVWEMSCRPSHDIILEWYVVGKDSLNTTQTPLFTVIQPISLDLVHWVYRAQLKLMHSNTYYHYEIFSYVEETRNIYYSVDDFYWIGANGSDTAHFGIISDNQSGIKSFMKVLDSLSDLPKSYPLQYGASVRKRVFPHYLIHAGDAVQWYDSLEQWQTNFADPLWFTWAHRQMSYTPPIIYAHGNHDQDLRNQYAYTIGERKGKTWFSTILASVYFVVLESQPNHSLTVQIEWLDREIRSKAWKNASFRIAIVHIAPFIEYWEPHAWNKLGEKHWGDYVRTKLVPLLINNGVDVIVSGHQHAYSRGWLPKELAHELTNDETQTKMTKSEQQQRWKNIVKKARNRQYSNSTSNFAYSIDRLHEGAMIAVVGGAGGQLDYDRVEDWCFYETSISGRYHYAVITINDARSRLTWRAYDTNTVIIDSFDLVRN